MQEHTQLTQKRINDDLLHSVFTIPRWWPGSTLIPVSYTHLTLPTTPYV